MATYIEDEETSELIEKLAKREGTNKTKALRELLRRELREPADKSAEDRFQDALAFVNNFPSERSLVKQADVDELYRHLDAR
jgi:hypothetical protein